MVVAIEELDQFFADRPFKPVRIDLVDFHDGTPGGAVEGTVVNVGGKGSGRHVVLDIHMGGWRFGVRYSEIKGVGDV